MLAKALRCASYILPALPALSAGGALAHALVLASTPASHATVAGPDLAVEVRFNSRVDPARSRLTLVRPSGVSVDLPLRLGGSSDTLSALASELAGGHYRLLWQTLSVDGHITHGEIPFDVSR
jgi:copper resistance protein C